jgi:hypothetical protein
MAVTLSLFAGAGAQFFDNNGNVLSGGKIYTYQAGTTTPLATYTTNSKSAFHTNPIILDSAGRVPSGGEIWLQLGVGYKFVLRTSAEVLIATYDNIPSAAQPPAANDADSIMYEQGYTVTAGSFVVGKIYRIASVGTTDFTLIGATNNTVGTHFVATGVGTGTGTAELSQTVETKLRETVSVKDFGAVGDGVTDDTAAIQAALDWSKANQSAVYFLDKRYYVSSTLNAGGSIIRSISGKPGGADPLYLKKPDGTYVFGSPNWEYFYNSTAIGRAYTWAQMIAATSYGCAIVSDFNGSILFANDDYEFDIDGIAVIGDHRKTSQDGIATAVPAAYFGNSQSLNNLAVIGCGRHGINLERGYEVATMARVTCSANNGYGLRTGKVSGIDCATEYLNIDSCVFRDNRLGGVWFAHWRKAIALYNCNFNNSGQYDSPGGIDPLLGYDRTVPTTTIAMAAGVWVNDVSLDIGSGFGFNFTMVDCFGEQMAKGLHLRGKQGGGIVRDVRIQNNTWVRASQVGTSFANGNENGAAHYFDTTYAADWVITGNYPQALINYAFASVPNRDTSNSIIFQDNGVPVSTSAEREFAKFYSPAPIQSAYYIRANGRTYGDQIIARDIGGLTVDGNVTTTAIGTDFTTATGVNLSNAVAVYSLTAHWQATNNNLFGAYLLFVTRMPTGQYIMTTIAAASVNGFTAVPTINTSTGELTIPAVAFYRYTLQRIDNMLTNTTP